MAGSPALLVVGAGFALAFVFGFEHSDFIDGLEYGGAATFFEFAGETDICLFI